MPPRASPKKIPEQAIRPLPLTAKQRARLNIRRASSGTATVVPNFMGEKPVYHKRTGGRAGAGMEIGGTFQMGLDPVMIDKMAEQKREENRLLAAIRAQGGGSAMPAPAQPPLGGPGEEGGGDPAGMKKGGVVRKKKRRIMRPDATKSKKKVARRATKKTTTKTKTQSAPLPKPMTKPAPLRGVKKTYGRRSRSGRHSTGMNAGGSTVRVDPLQAQQQAFEHQRQLEVMRALQSRGERAGYNVMQKEQKEATGLILDALKEQKQGKSQQKEIQQMEHKLAAEEKVENMVGPELEKASMSTEESAVRNAARERLWAEEAMHDDSLQRNAEEYIEDWREEFQDLQGRIKGAKLQAHEVGNKTALKNLTALEDTFTQDMNERINLAEKRVSNLNKAYKATLFEPEAHYGGDEFFEATGPETSRYEPSRQAWLPLKSSLDIDQNEMRRVYKKGFADVEAKGVPRLNFQKAHDEDQVGKWKKEVNEWEEGRADWYTRRFASLVRTKNMRISDEEKQKVAAIDADEGTLAGSAWAKYGEAGPPKPETSDDLSSKSAAALRGAGDLKVYIASLIKDIWTRKGKTGKIISTGGAIAIGALIDKTFGSNLQMQISEMGGQLVSTVIGAIAGLLLRGGASVVAGGAAGAGNYIWDSLTGWATAAERERKKDLARGN